MSSGQTKERTRGRGGERDGGKKWEQDSSAMDLNGGKHPRSTCGLSLCELQGVHVTLVCI